MLKEFREDLSSIKKIQSEMKDTLIEIKNNLQGNNSRVTKVENQIHDLTHKEAKNNQNNKKKKRIKKSKGGISSLWENFGHSNICIIGVTEGERKSKKLEIYLKK